MTGQKVENHPELHYKHFNSLDTLLIDGRFLRITIFYDDDTGETMHKKAYWGNEENSFETELFEIRGNLHESLKWTTDNCLILVDGCGTNCMYAIVFNAKIGEMFWTPVDFYPQNYTNDNNELILYGEYINEKSSLVILNVENNLRDTLVVPEDWVRGVGFINNLLDEIQVKNNEICIAQFGENDGEATQIIKKEIVLKNNETIKQ